MNKALYWFWVQKTLGYHAKINTLMRYYGSAEKLYNAGESSWRLSGLFGDEIPVSKISSMRNTSPEECLEVYNLCKREGVSVLTPEDENYPKELLKLPDYPAVLYVKGDISFLNRCLSVAVIGTRKPSSYGKEICRKITEGISVEGFAVISGGALGIDSVSHKTAIEAGGKTVLVEGCGYKSGYLPENDELRKAVSENGAVISEYPPFTKANSFTFPKRNRIISGLSKGVLVIEAGAKSGTLNTASHARAQGKDLFVVPGDVASGMYTGSNRLLTEGAKAVFSSEDILKYYSDYVEFKNEKITGEEPFSKIDRVKEERVKTKKAVKTLESDRKEVHNNKKIVNITAESVSVNAFLVYNLMSGKEMCLDDIVRESGLPVPKVLACLTELELMSAVRLMEGGRYSHI